MNVMTNDERFADHEYGEWLLQDPDTRAGAWVPASAAGCIAQAMTILSTPTHRRWLVCAGAMEGWAMYVNKGFDEHAVMRDHATVYESLEEAEQARLRFEKFHFQSWSRGGGVKNLKDWSIPFLELVP